MPGAVRFGAGIRTLKVFPADRRADLVRGARFLQEARAASTLNHPGIVTIYEIESAEGIDFLVMELVSGKASTTVRPETGATPARTSSARPCSAVLPRGCVACAAFTPAAGATPRHPSCRPVIQWWYAGALGWSCTIIGGVMEQECNALFEGRAG